MKKTHKTDIARWMFHVKRSSTTLFTKTLWLLALVLAAAACADPMPMYASYQPAVARPDGLASAHEHAHEQRPETVVESAGGAHGKPPAGQVAKITEVASGPRGDEARGPSKAPDGVSEEVAPDEPEDSRVELNSASLAQLQTLPGIGPATAQKIVAYRERRPFRRTSQLKNIRGVGAKTYKRLAPLVKVEAPAAP